MTHNPFQRQISAAMDAALAQRSPQRARHDLAAALAAADRQAAIERGRRKGRAELEAARQRGRALGRAQGHALALREHQEAVLAALDRRITAGRERRARLRPAGPIRLF
jgi:hypothetical protein